MEQKRYSLKREVCILYDIIQLYILFCRVLQLSNHLLYGNKVYVENGDEFDIKIVEDGEWIRKERKGMNLVTEAKCTRDHKSQGNDDVVGGILLKGALIVTENEYTLVQTPVFVYRKTLMTLGRVVNAH